MEDERFSVPVLPEPHAACRHRKCGIWITKPAADIRMCLRPDLFD